MKRLILSATDYTPAIDLNPANLSMHFTGVSRPENVGLFYQQVIDWVEEIPYELKELGSSTLKIVFKLDYCNSATQKYILIILEKIVEIKDQGLDLVVEWYYDQGDDKMLEDGEDISDAIGLAFNFYPFES
ncbi:MAG: DUF1987 domain-containing protein [Bacteroidales bacterium]|nr:DUF1987 domain-containing protein [Bacteroidales bacterium]MBN2817584.1 DUF1987 domain-containing protein [Bacteroidales bacterium]